MWKLRKITSCQGHNHEEFPYSPSTGRRSTLGSSKISYGAASPIVQRSALVDLVWYYRWFCTSSIHSLLTIAVRPSICDVASGTDAPDLENMHLCSFGIAEFHILLWRDQEWTLTYPWWVAHDLWTWVVRWFPICGGGGEGAADRMRTCCFSLGRSVGETHQRQHSWNALSDLSAPTKWCFSTFRNTMRCSGLCHKQKSFPHYSKWPFALLEW